MTDTAARARALSLRFASWPSITGTSGEADFAARLKDTLAGFDETWLMGVPGGQHARQNVLALKRGTSARAIVLTGHFDVVPIDGYGPLSGLAFDPERLLPAAIARLEATGENPLALQDLRGGAFLPGRGLLDMKAGLAAGIAAMEAYDGAASLIFLGVCDEEETSSGARAAAPLLRRLAAERGLDIGLVINLDAISDQGDGARGRAAAFGSVGKQLLTAYVVGQETHACYPEDGVNAAYLAAELICEFERAPALAEETGGERAAPPTALHAKDLKAGYNVTTPGAAWVYWNTLQHRRSPEDVLRIALDLARRAMARAERKLGRAVKVVTFAELGVTAARPPASGLDIPEQMKRATAGAAAAHNGPCVILGFGAIPYAAVALRDEGLRVRITRALAPLGIGALNYFPGISDMSFFGEAAAGHAVTAANTPLWGKAFDAPESARFPCVNIGPWGRDYHHWLERLHAPYAFDVLPRALRAAIDAALESD